MRESGCSYYQDINPSVVQIRADKSEIERRIAAFIKKKQIEVDDTNRREFCSVLRDDHGEFLVDDHNLNFTKLLPIFV
jgi:hypothetical protein